MRNWTGADSTPLGEFSSSSTVFSFPGKIKRILVDEPRHNWWPDIQNRLEYLIRLESGWDGYKGEPVSFPNATFALNVLESICANDTPPPQIVPGSGGDLQIEWHIDSIDIELHVIAPNNVEAWICSPETGENGKELVLTNNFIEVATTLRIMTERSFAEAAAA